MALQAKISIPCLPGVTEGLRPVLVYQSHKEEVI